MELTATLEIFADYNLTLVVIGLGVLALAVLLHHFSDYPFSFPIVALALGYLAFALPLGLKPPDPHEHGALAVHLTELGVIISLMGVGLKIDRMPSLRTWSSTWRLLAICMPLTIAGVAFLGWWMIGLTPAAAVLLGAALAPTDPVLAADVQVGEPEGSNEEDIHPKKKEDELRFTLTSEAGLNDSLAFPFTYLALLMVAEGTAPSNWIGEWLLIDVVYKLAMALVAGLALGWLLARILLRLPIETEPQRMKAGVGALAGTLLLYGITEVLGGYGFLAVFIGAMTIKHYEQTHQAHKSLHTFAEQSEQLLMLGILIALGAAIAGGLLASLTWEAALLGILLVFVLRPLAGMISMFGSTWLPLRDRAIASFFGIRGIGCLFYLAYGLHEGEFMEAELLWSTCAFAVVLSVFVHGVAASPVMKFRERRIPPHPRQPSSNC
ncbi:sodium/proton antiporter, CPA1 family [Marinobacter daqiaonensis]|uniref:Sodium/proton antiporter, CPA1 family n=1 Tax=Marinobacter daqiaonensis TaxID=650891 RepID=A0A1I6I5P3_9GAMM|nr:cation:proton antiporter [Marinobacter daqiaonensis]SFR61958.1 sodium/proton antiporter, CPA1 family [Marinobacter daqiaonensis]